MTQLAVPEIDRRRARPPLAPTKAEAHDADCGRPYSDAFGKLGPEPCNGMKS
jgi:hypothetical protein